MEVRFLFQEEQNYHPLTNSTHADKVHNFSDARDTILSLGKQFICLLNPKLLWIFLLLGRERLKGGT